MKIDSAYMHTHTIINQKQKDSAKETQRAQEAQQKKTQQAKDAITQAESMRSPIPNKNQTQKKPTPQPNKPTPQPNKPNPIVTKENALIPRFYN